ncbi:hypothetical protein BD770DRAFT_354786 [Pilaira anomala]|nr:hypothetical protein BD770DRAFT_354786 [Pilaira anomala]
MKFTILSAAGILAAISQASALEVCIVTPWADTVWTSGGHGNITWKTTAADVGTKCDIYMLNGDIKNSNIVAQVTDPATPVDCSLGIYDIHPLGDFATGKYSIRIGQSATNTWVYSSLFQFNGNGTHSPISLAPTTSATVVNGTTPAVSSGVKPNAAVATATAAKASGSAAVSAAQASTTTESSGASLNMNTAAVALGAVAAIAFAF